MTELDTNVLVRYLAQDDAKQSAQASRLIESFSPQRPGFIGMVNLVELVWVLQSCYDAEHATVVATLDRLLRTRTLVLENAEAVAAALRLFATGHKDFADCLILCAAKLAGCERIYSFDKQAIRRVGMTALS
ncbi:MAG: type II toxin-antitoxin system VapC family toxin [Pseudomonadota bacterium]|nr:type II toxin-antitoxin system VapC family toxin [Pseudomonadota bacterium]